MKSVLFIGAHGLGDSLLAFQCADLLKSKVDYKISVMPLCRQEIYAVIKYLFFHKFSVIKGEEKFGENNLILTDESYINSLQRLFDEVYYVIPDLLFRNPHTFNYNKYFLHPQTIKSHRLLTHKWTPEKIIYVGLVSTTEGYVYKKIPELIKDLAIQMPDYKIYFPKIKSWAGHELTYGNFSNMPTNVIIDEDPNFINSIEWLKKSCYGIYTDNGISHLAYHLGQPRLLLDPRMAGPINQTLPWIARWRETLEDSVPITIEDTESLAKLVRTNTKIPQTCLLSRFHVLSLLTSNSIQDSDWGNILFFKH